MHVLVHTLNSLRYRNFLLLWLSMMSTGGGFWTQQLVVGYFTYARTKSPFLTSMALGLQMLPFIVAGPIGGIVADRFDGLSRVARQRLVFDVLAVEMENEIHALAMRTLTPAEAIQGQGNAG